jgi:hypothetical protein
MRPRPGPVAIAIAGLASPAAQACTLCHSPTARLVRDHVLRHGFAANLAAVAAPLLVLGIFIALAGLRVRRTGARP